jgi:pilus assembly protein Flp/PilA
MKDAVVRFLKEEDGVTAVEYGIIAGLMAILLIAVFGAGGALDLAIRGVFSRISTALGGPAA